MDCEPVEANHFVLNEEMMDCDSLKEVDSNKGTWHNVDTCNLDEDSKGSENSMNSIMNEEKIAILKETGIVTDEMIEEEKKLINESLLYRQPKSKRAMLEENKYANREKHYIQLKELLVQSKFYTQYLAGKINESKLKMSECEAKFRNPEQSEKPPENRSELKPLCFNSQEPINNKNGNKSLIKTKECKVVLYDCLRTETKENKGKSRKRKLDTKTELPGNQSLKAVSDVNTPVLFTGGVLRKYQVEGFNWLKVLFENGLNGILGDEMGLGKTAQTIAMYAHLIEMNIAGPFLICVPLSTLPNWVSEFKRFTPKIPVILYHGNKDERKELLKKLKPVTISGDLKAVPVVITTYEIINKDVNVLKKYNWVYLTIDEGHRIKNFECLLVKNLQELSTGNRLLLTGTPLQNSLSELWSLLNFLMPELFHDLDIFESWFNVTSMLEDNSNEYIVQQEREKKIIKTLRDILEPFLLRRVKHEVELDLPPKREFLIYASLTPKQKDLYKAVLDKTIADYLMIAKPKGEIVLNKQDRRKKKTSDDNIHYVKMENSVKKFSYKNRLMDLRKCVNHPYLIEYPLDLATESFKIDEELVEMSGKLGLLDILLKELVPKHKILIFSQMVEMLNILHDFCWLRNYSFRRLDGSMFLEDRLKSISEFNSDPDVNIFLLSTRAGGLGLNLTAADTVIIYDSDWNPQCDLQAMDRCHRIGQSKAVIVYRFVVSKTIDEYIIKRASAKRKLEKMIIHKKRSFGTNLDDVNLEELKLLLESDDHGQVVNADGFTVLSKEEMKVLLERNFSAQEKLSKQLKDNNRIQIL